jgi:Transglycosylase SLT domain
MPRDAEREAIIRAAREMGIDPSYALAVAERESNFDPSAGGKGTIRGLYQLTGKARGTYGDSTDAYTQTKGWGAMQSDVRKEMAGPLGREPTTAEGYLGHHFGGVRAGRMLKMDPDTPVQAVFTARELRDNPHIVKAGTVGNLNATTVADIERRQAKFGGAEPETPAGTTPSGKVDFTPPATDIAASTATAPASDVTAPAAPSAAPAAEPAQGGNSFKGLPNFDTPSVQHPAPLPTPRMPQIAIRGIPNAPQAPASALGNQDPFAVMLGQMSTDQPARQAEQPQQDPSLMGIPV